MMCVSCGHKIRDTSKHHASKQQCGHCHYFGVTGGVKTGGTYRGGRPRGQQDSFEKWVCKSNIGYAISAQLIMLKSPYEKAI